MNTKSDWQEVNRQLREESRGSGAEPPTAETLVAYKRGELSEEQAEHVREWLVTYPELARMVAEPFPAAAEPGDPDFLSEDELDTRWNALQARMERPSNVVAYAPAEGRVLQFWRAGAALAAALAMVFGALTWSAETRASKAETQAGKLAKQLTLPRVISEEQLLLPDGRRGGNDPAAVLTTAGDSFLLVAPLLGEKHFESYRIELISAATGDSQPLWVSSSLQPRQEGTFEILVPREFLVAGKYRLELYGLAGAEQEHLNSFTIRVPESVNVRTPSH
jgi:hypothetical protein